jgi:hypothetical protein
MMKTPLRALALGLIAASLLSFSPVHAQGLRPEIGRPLQAASEALRAGNARQALVRVREAEAVPGRTAAENLTINRMKAAAAQRAGDNATAVQALEAIASAVSGNELGQIAEQLAAAYAQLRNNGKSAEWLQRARAAGNNSASLRQLETYLQSVSGDFAAIGRDAAAAVSAAEQAGRRPDEADLLRLADAQNRQNQTTAYVNTLEKLVFYYPGKRDYWGAYLGRLPRKSGFSPRFELDVLRLRLASGTMTRTEDFMEFSQLALQAGLPAEAERIIERGYASGALGTGPEAERHQRLRDLTARRLAESRAAIAGQAAEAASAPDGEALVRVGFAYASLGDVARGAQLIQQGITKGRLRNPEDAKLRLGMAQLQSPATRSAGLATLRGVRGTDGSAEIARLWMVMPANGAS